MTVFFDHYNIKSNNSLVELNYSRTSKDWFDFLILAIFGTAALFITGFLIVQLIKSEFSWIYIVVIVLFGFVGVIKIIELISRLSEPTKGIITIDKTSNTIVIKKPHFRKERIEVAELAYIEYCLHTDFVRVTNSKQKRRFWIEVHLYKKGDEKIKILNINPARIVDLGNERNKRELFKTAVPLITRISEELGIEVIYKGVIHEEKK
jgi:hypothetical protein